MSGKWLMKSDKHMNKAITEKMNFAKARFFFNTKKRTSMMCNKEGYSDKTADIVISRVYKEEMSKKKGDVKKNGDKRLTYSKESKKARQY